MIFFASIFYRLQICPRGFTSYLYGYTNVLNGLNGLKFVRFTFIVPEPSRKQLFANQILGQFCNRFDLAISGPFPCYFGQFSVHFGPFFRHCQAQTSFLSGGQPAASRRFLTMISAGPAGVGAGSKPALHRRQFLPALSSRSQPGDDPECLPNRGGCGAASTAFGEPQRFS